MDRRSGEHEESGRTATEGSWVHRMGHGQSRGPLSASEVSEADGPVQGLLRRCDWELEREGAANALLGLDPDPTIVPIGDALDDG